MTIPSDQSSIGRNLIKQITVNSPSPTEAKTILAEHAGKVFELLDAGEIETETFQVALMMFANDFRRLTHDSHEELNPLEKLKLQYAFMAITDDIKEMILNKIQKGAEAKQQQAWSDWLVEGALNTANYAKNALGVGAKPQDKTISLDEFLRNITSFQETMGNPEMPVALTNVRKVIAEVLERGQEQGLSGKVMDMDVRDLVSFLKTVPELQKIHLERSAMAEDRYDEVKDSLQPFALKAAASIGKAAQDYFLQKKDETVKYYAKGLTPESLFGEKSFKNMIEEVLTGALQEKGLDYLPIRRVVTSTGEVYRKHLTDNLKALSDEKNMARLGIRMTKELSKVAKGVRQLKENSTPEDLIREFGYGDMTLQEFREMMDKDISHNIARLISTKAIASKDDNVVKTSKGVWGRIKAGLKKFASLFQKRVAEKALKKLAPPTWIVDSFPKDLQSMEKVMEMLDLKKEFTNLNNTSEVILFHLFGQLMQEAGDIAREYHVSRDTVGDGNVSGFRSNKEANDAFKSEVVRFINEIKQLQKPIEEGGLLQSGLFQLVGLFGDIADRQGSGDSIFDVGTPAFSVLQPAWYDWLTK
jgi:hypothetical protein